LSSSIWVRRASFALLAVILTLGVMTYRALRDGATELEHSERAFDRGDLPEAVLHARRAVIAYAPGVPHVRAGVERLRAVAVGAEAAGDLRSARLAWGALRGALVEVRHLRQPLAADLAEADKNLARLSLGRAGDAPVTGNPDGAIRRELARAPGVASWASALLSAGFLLALAGLSLVASTGVTREGRVLGRPFSLGLVLFVVGAACWTLAAYQA
jgi:hypothetical protein